jgi:hypothetical protein
LGWGLRGWIHLAKVVRRRGTEDTQGSKSLSVVVVDKKSSAGKA